jgi:carbamoyl-phosphate synthase/aspartate carbamoyltransferase
MVELSTGKSTAVVRPFPPVTARPVGSNGEPVVERLATLELEDGSAYQGYSFGAEKSVSGELVFQTGMLLTYGPNRRVRC